MSKYENIRSLIMNAFEMSHDWDISAHGPHVEVTLYRSQLKNLFVLTGLLGELSRFGLLEASMTTWLCGTDEDLETGPQLNLLFNTVLNKEEA